MPAANAIDPTRLENGVFKGYKGLEAIGSADASLESATSLYVNACEKMGIKPNSAIVANLPKVPGSFCMRELNVACNFIGDKGLEALFPVIQHNPMMSRVRLSDNGLRNETVLRLLSIVKEHPRVMSLDLSGNKFLSMDVGTQCLKIAQSNPNFMHISLAKTSVSKKLQDTLEIRLKDNRRRTGEGNRKHLEQRIRVERKALFEAKDLFDSLDRDKGGSVTFRELLEIARERGTEHFSIGGIDGSVFTAMDTNRDGDITLLEFLKVVFDKVPEDDILYWINCYSDFVHPKYKPAPELSPETLNEIKEIFISFDRSGDGVLSKTELIEACRSSSLCMDVDKYFEEADSSGDGLVDLQEFIQLMTPYYTGSL